MKVIISGGAKTENIVTGINKRFNSGGVDFIVVPFIEDIDDIYQRGEYFDKAIIIEQSWNHDFEDTDEISIRTKVNNFANSSANRGLQNVSYVFLTQDEDVAGQIYEEILPIQHSSVVLVKQPRYSVTFFATLVTTEIDKFGDDIVYKPQLEEEKVEEPQDVIPENTVPEYNPNYTEDDIGREIFGEEEFNANRLDKKEEIDIDNDLKGEEDGIPDFDFGGDFEGFGEDFGGGFDGDTPPVDFDEPEVDGDTFNSGEIPSDDFNPDFDENFGQFPSEDNSGFDDIPADTGFEQDFIPVDEGGIEDIGPEIETFPQSGEIPDYSGPDDDFNGQAPGINFDKTDEPEQPLFDDSLYNEEDQGYIPQEEPQIQGDYNPDLDDYNANQQYTGGFDDSDYEGEREVVAPTQTQFQRPDMSNDQIKATLDAFANRGNSILVTGCGGCGTSTIALNLANIINNLGYTVLLVDLDTENKAQSYISKDNYECVEPDSAGLMAAINSTSGINAHISIVRQGFHLLTMGMSSDSAQIDKIIHKDKISRFINLAKTSHNFVVYDVPFKTAMGFGKDFTFMADNVVVTVDCSNWGITKTMLNMCNIEDDDMQETLFNRGQLLFNRYRVLNKVMGRKVKTAIDITKVMDFKVRELLGEDPGYYFQSMHICGLINDDSNFESGWFESTQYSDTAFGSKVFLDMLKNIVLKR